MIRIYLDNCCYNRPYDDQSQLTVSMETQAKLWIQNMVKNKRFELATSYVLIYENSRNPHLMRRESISEYIDKFSHIYVSEKNRDSIEKLATDIMSTGVKHADACHVASAILSECDVFLTTDKRLLKYDSDKVRVMNPIDFIQQIGEESDDK